MNPFRRSETKLDNVTGIVTFARLLCVCMCAYVRMYVCVLCVYPSHARLGTRNFVFHTRDF
jgi:hypothetical protein